MQGDTKRWEKRSILFAGVLLVAIGLVFNQWTVAYFFTFDGSLAFGSAVLVWVFDTLFLVAGVVLLYYRSRIAASFTLSRRGALVVLLIGVLMFSGLEIAARVLDTAHGGDIAGEREKGGEDIIPFRIFGPAFYTHKDDALVLTSRHGEEYPFEKGDTAVRIVVFGGSTTQQIIDGKHYPLLLQEHLQEYYLDKNIEVINVSNSAYATPHSLITFMLDVLSWQPDVVVLSHNINDLTAAYFPEFVPDYSNKYSHEFYTKPRKFSERCTVCAAYEWSTLYWLIEQQIEGYAYRQTVGPDFYQRKEYGVEPPKAAAETFRRNLVTFVTLARANDIDVVLGTQPLEPSFERFDRQMRWKPYNDTIVWPRHDEYVAHHAAYNAIIRDVARRYGTHLVANERSFNGNPSYFIDNVHYTMEGLTKLAENYFEVFIADRVVE